MALWARTGPWPRVDPRSAVGHVPSFATPLRHVWKAAITRHSAPNVWKAAITRHSAPNVGNAPVKEVGIVSAARMQVSSRHQVKKSEIFRCWSDNENRGRIGGTPGGGGRPAVPLISGAAQGLRCPGELCGRGATARSRIFRWSGRPTARRRCAAPMPQKHRAGRAHPGSLMPRQWTWRPQTSAMQRRADLMRS